jgi:hypothetical protein
MSKLIKEGRCVSVNGRFVPESRMKEITNNILNQGYPQIGFKGTIIVVLDNSCIVEFSDFSMEIPNDDLLFSMEDYNKYKE